MRRTAATHVLLIGLVAALVLAVPTAPAGAVTELSDTLSIVKEDIAPSNAEIAIRLVDATPLETDRVLVGRDDVFADSMAAGVLQGGSPLLLVPPDGPLPDDVLAAIGRTGARRVTLLGGVNAVGPSVEQALADAGYEVDRRAGASRLETAIEIARDAPGSRTAILARAFPAPEAVDPTQAFADSLAAGYLAADNGWPILLTQTEVLSAPTREYLAQQAFDRVVVLGGTAAIADAVVDEVAQMAGTVERVAGSDRFGTGVEVAKVSGAQSAAEVARVTLVEGQGEDAWAGGFAAAAHAAFFDAPIVLSTGDRLPAATQAWLQPAASAQAGAADVRLTCVTPSAVCAQARQALGLPDAVPVGFDPPDGSTVRAGQRVTVDVGTSPDVTVGGTCAGDATMLPEDGRLTITAAAGETCVLVITLALPGGTTQTETIAYLVGEAGLDLVSATADGTAGGGQHPDIAADGSAVAFISTGDLVGLGSGAPRSYVSVEGVVTAVDVRPDGSPSTGLGGVVPGQQDRPRLTDDGRHVVFTSTDPGLDAEGAIGAQGRNLYVRDLETGLTRLASLDVDGAPVRRPAMADVGGDGDVVAFTGEGAVTEGGGSTAAGFVNDLSSGTVEVVHDHDGDPVMNLTPANLALSGGGTHVAFTSSRPDLVPDDTNARPDVFVYGVSDRTIVRASVSDQGEQSVGESAATDGQIAIDATGTRVAFVSGATNLHGAGAGPGDDVFLRDLAAGTTMRISSAPDGGDLDDVTGVDMDPTGTFVVFASTRPVRDAAAGAGCAVHRVRVADLSTTRLTPEQGDTVCTGSVAVATDGSAAVQLGIDHAVEDTNGIADVYLAPPA